MYFKCASQKIVFRVFLRNAKLPHDCINCFSYTLSYALTRRLGQTEQSSIHLLCRLYLINSPVVRAENLRFKEEGVRDVLKDVFLPWYNAYRFLVQNVQRLQKVHFCDSSKL